MKTRIITAVVCALFFIPFLMFSGTWAFPVLLSLLALAGVYEMLKCIGEKIPTFLLRRFRKRGMETQSAHSHLPQPSRTGNARVSKRFKIRTITFSASNRLRIFHLIKVTGSTSDLHSPYKGLLPA